MDPRPFGACRKGHEFARTMSRLALQHGHAKLSQVSYMDLVMAMRAWEKRRLSSQVFPHLLRQVVKVLRTCCNEAEGPTRLQPCTFQASAKIRALPTSSVTWQPRCASSLSYADASAIVAHTGSFVGAACTTHTVMASTRAITRCLHPLQQQQGEAHHPGCPHAAPSHQGPAYGPPIWRRECRPLNHCQTDEARLPAL